MLLSPIGSSRTIVPTAADMTPVTHGMEQVKEGERAVTGPQHDAGRRSRRGFAYQDAVTLLDCLDMHDGAYDSVGFEDLDDIVCQSGGHATFRQVKTQEDGSRHSIASVCRPEIKDRAETSIIGRLFSGKPLSDNTRFCLVLNETPQADLGAFKIERGDPRGPVAPAHCQAVIARLEKLPVANGVTVAWYVDRFEVLVEPRTIDQLEDAILRRLAEPVAALLGQPPLHPELEDVLIRLSTVLTRDARAVKARTWDSSTFAAELDGLITAATGRRRDGTDAPLEDLVAKLGKAGLPAPEAEEHARSARAFRLRYRSAIGGERQAMESLYDHVFAICAEVSARRRAGEIAAGPAAYAATVTAVCDRPLVPARAVSQPDRLAALSEITARCQNRYTDDA